MKKSRLIFFAIFAAWHLFVFLFSLYVKSKQGDLGFLYSLLAKIPIFIYGSLFGLLLLLTDFIWEWIKLRQQASHDEEMLLENNTLKAKIYDLQEGKNESHLVPPASK
jgi:ABC-type phosphate transport system permease subunit